jgi:hypothetical protein
MLIVFDFTEQSTLHITELFTESNASFIFPRKERVVVSKNIPLYRRCTTFKHNDNDNSILLSHLQLQSFKTAVPLI